MSELYPNPVLTYRLVADGVYSILYVEELVFSDCLVKLQCPCHGSVVSSARRSSAFLRIASGQQ